MYVDCFYLIIKMTEKDETIIFGLAKHRINPDAFPFLPRELFLEPSSEKKSSVSDVGIIKFGSTNPGKKFIKSSLLNYEALNFKDFFENNYSIVNNKENWGHDDTHSDLMSISPLSDEITNSICLSLKEDNKFVISEEAKSAEFVHRHKSNNHVTKTIDKRPTKSVNEHRRLSSVGNMLSMIKNKQVEGILEKNDSVKINAKNKVESETIYDSSKFNENFGESLKLNKNHLYLDQYCLNFLHGNCTSGSYCSKKHKFPRDDMISCRHWRKYSNCIYGDNCWLYHEKYNDINYDGTNGNYRKTSSKYISQNPDRDIMKEYCLDFVFGNNNCSGICKKFHKYPKDDKHECTYWNVRGSCKFGDNCWFYHNTKVNSKEEIPNASEGRLNIHSDNTRKLILPFKKEKCRKESNSISESYLKGDSNTACELSSINNLGLVSSSPSFINAESKNTLSKNMKDKTESSYSFNKDTNIEEGSKKLTESSNLSHDSKEKQKLSNAVTDNLNNDIENRRKLSETSIIDDSSSDEYAFKIKKPRIRKFTISSDDESLAPENCSSHLTNDSNMNSIPSVKVKMGSKDSSLNLSSKYSENSLTDENSLKTRTKMSQKRMLFIDSEDEAMVPSKKITQKYSSQNEDGNCTDMSLIKISHVTDEVSSQSSLKYSKKDASDKNYSTPDEKIKVLCKNFQKITKNNSKSFKTKSSKQFNSSHNCQKAASKIMQDRQSYKSSETAGRALKIKPALAAPAKNISIAAFRKENSNKNIVDSGTTKGSNKFGHATGQDISSERNISTLKHLSPKSSSFRQIVDRTDKEGKQIIMCQIAIKEEHVESSLSDNTNHLQCTSNSNIIKFASEESNQCASKYREEHVMNEKNKGNDQNHVKNEKNKINVQEYIAKERNKLNDEEHVTKERTKTNVEELVEKERNMIDDQGHVAREINKIKDEEHVAVERYKTDCIRSTSFDILKKKGENITLKSTQINIPENFNDCTTDSLSYQVNHYQFKNKKNKESSPELLYQYNKEYKKECVTDEMDNKVECSSSFATQKDKDVQIAINSNKTNVDENSRNGCTAESNLEYKSKQHTIGLCDSKCKDCDLNNISVKDEGAIQSIANTSEGSCADNTNDSFGTLLSVDLIKVEKTEYFEYMDSCDVSLSVMDKEATNLHIAGGIKQEPEIFESDIDVVKEEPRAELMQDSSVTLDIIKSECANTHDINCFSSENVHFEEFDDAASDKTEPFDEEAAEELFNNILNRESSCENNYENDTYAMQSYNYKKDLCLEQSSESCSKASSYSKVGTGNSDQHIYKLCETASSHHEIIVEEISLGELWSEKNNEVLDFTCEKNMVKSVKENCDCEPTVTNLLAGASDEASDALANASLNRNVTACDAVSTLDLSDPPSNAITEAGKVLGNVALSDTIVNEDVYDEYAHIAANFIFNNKLFNWEKQESLRNLTEDLFAEHSDYVSDYNYNAVKDYLQENDLVLFENTNFSELFLWDINLRLLYIQEIQNYESEKPVKINAANEYKNNFIENMSLPYTYYNARTVACELAAWSRA